MIDSHKSLLFIINYTLFCKSFNLFLIFIMIVMNAFNANQSSLTMDSELDFVFLI